jgi:hypothetical protein
MARPELTLWPDKKSTGKSVSSKTTLELQKVTLLHPAMPQYQLTQSAGAE